ncbi:hypothetical protein L7F22_034521 [Adiantum nelumboides]|nr:hypothetical protein [Adiantum nelumboides]
MGLKDMPLVEDVNIDAVKYQRQKLQAPHLTGYSLKLSTWLLESYLVGGPIIANMLRANKYTETLSQTTIPDAPLFAPQFPEQMDLESATKVVEETSSPQERVGVAVKCLPSMSSKSSDVPFQYWRIRDYADAYRTGSTTPSDVAGRLIAAIEDSQARDPPLSLFISYDAKDIQKQADECTHRFLKGTPLSILDGVFMAVKDEIDCLPYGTRAAGVQMDPAKIEAIRNWPDLKNVHEVRSFLGLCSYYMQYVRKFAEIASPLHMLTQKGVAFSWGVTEVTAFQTLKDKMTTGPVLILSDLQKSFEVYCDACGRSLGAVLMQEGRVIAYESRMFSKPEMTAQIYEKELLAVIHALTQWRHYLLGADFTVFSDHQSLRYFLSQKQLSEKQMRWANILSQFHFQIVHVQGQKNVVADALSRKPLVQAISAIHHSIFEDMIDQYATDPDIADIFTRIRDGETVAGYSLREGYLMRKTMLCVTRLLREKVMTECHCPPYTGHRGIATTMKGVERYFYWPRLKKDVEEFVRSCLVCQKVKFDRHKAQGLLQPLPIPTRPCERGPSVIPPIAEETLLDLPLPPSDLPPTWLPLDFFLSDSVSDILTEDRVVYQLMFAIEALLEFIRVPVQDLEDLVEQSKDCIGRLVWLQDQSSW